MGESLKKPGDVLEGRGQLLLHGRFIAPVDYYLTIPNQTHFFINPTGDLSLSYDKYRGGFILLTPDDTQNLEMNQYTLQLANNSKITIKIERKYTKVKHKGELRISFWVKVV